MMKPIDLLYLALCEENRLIAEFVDVLEQESKQLSDSPAVRKLAQLAKKKTAIIDMMVKVDAKRQDLLTQCGFEGDMEGLKCAATQHHFLQDLYSFLVQAAEHARNLNISNGKIIEIHIKQNLETMNQLRRLAGRNGLYNAQGLNQTLDNKPNTDIEAS